MMDFEPYINDLLHPSIKNFEDLQNHFDLVERLQKSFYLTTTEDEMITNGSLPLTEISVELFEKAIEELKCDNINGKQKFNKFNLKYAARITRKACISPYCFILALIYIKRLKQINPTYVKSQSACDLFLISLIVSSKYLYEENTDEEIFNFEWAQISGIDLKTLNQMEIEFLFKLNWQAHISPKDFIEEWILIENLAIKNECKKRSFQLTYNEIMRIFENDKIYQQLTSNFLTHISKFILIASFAYSSIILCLVLLSRSTILQNSLLFVQNHQNLINQTYYGDYYYSSFEDAEETDEEVDEKLNLINEQIIENLDENKRLINNNEKLNESTNESIDSDLNSKKLNLNKLNGLNLNELNNGLNFLSRLDNENVELKDLSNEISIIQKTNQKKCEFSHFNELINNYTKLSVNPKNNFSDFNLKKELSFIQPTIRKLFLDYRVY